MKYRDPLKQILFRTRPYWDQDETRPAVRWAFGKALQCRTPELGAEVYGSGKEERIFNHTCKSRSCSSCGYRATANWQRGWWAALPDALYKGITFTMPRELWLVFHDNPLLAKALPAFAAKLIEARVRAKYGLRVGVIAIPHTFNGPLEFNSHVHTMVTGGGLYGSSDTWVSRVYYERDALMEAWRRAVIALLRAALRSGSALYEDGRRPDGRDAHPAGESLVEHQDSVLQVERAFPAIRRSLRKAATHRPASHHLHREANRQVLVQGQEAAPQGLRAVLTGRVH